MRFFDRKDELALLRTIREESFKGSCMTILKGRRRVGKTSLLQEAYWDQDYLYLFVARKNEADLCEDFRQEIARYFKLAIPGKMSSFEEVFKFLLDMAEREPCTIVIDEFQEFLRVNPSIFSVMQRDWDRKKRSAKVNLIVSGSINRMMEQIFAADQPLYGRATHEINLDPFTTATVKEILSEHAPDYTVDDLLALWTFTGGVAKYVELLMDAGAFTLDAMVKRMVSEGSTIINEGKVLLVDEFGKDYGTYFSILSLVAAGNNSRSEIENAIGSDVGGYLSKLEGEYRLVSKDLPVCERKSNRNVHYTLKDNFLRFWFRFVWKYQSLIELRAYGRLQDVIFRDYRTFSGKALEDYYRHKFAESGKFTKIGNWWDRKGQNEIDIVAIDDLAKTISFCEVKRNGERIDLGALSEKAEAFHRATGDYADYHADYLALPMSEM